MINRMKEAGAALSLAFAWISIAENAAADEGGVSFWLPGQLASFTAAPQKPGSSLAATGYFYEQLTADEGQAEILGENKSGIIGIGAQFGRFIPLGRVQGFLQVKGYGELDAHRRADGWNVWLTFALSPSGE